MKWLLIIGAIGYVFFGGMAGFFGKGLFTFRKEQKLIKLVNRALAGDETPLTNREKRLIRERIAEIDRLKQRQ